MHQTLDGGCTDFSCVLKVRNNNGDLMVPDGDPMGTQKLKKVPMGTHLGAVKLQENLNKFEYS